MPYQHDIDCPGIEGHPAPDFSLPLNLHADGTPSSEPLTLASLKGDFRLLYCFQSWCPGCHSSGFPALTEIVQAFLDKPGRLSCAVIQTVFEGFEENSYEALIQTRTRYPLAVPFAHDEGEGKPGHGSVIMRDYHNGGTPWFILIAPDGRVVFNDFRIQPQGVIDAVNATRHT
jgi:hypothetical protein